MSKTSGTDPRIAELGACLGLSPERAAQCGDMIETLLLDRLATKEDCDALTKRIVDFRKEINDGADVMFRHLITAIKSRPEPQRATIYVPPESVLNLERAIAKRLDRLRAQIWWAVAIVLLAMMMLRWWP
jgi:hypothetical protein